MKWDHQLVAAVCDRAFKEGERRGFKVSCAVVDAAGRTVSVLRHADASWQTPEFALGKARLASAFRTSTGAMFARLQKDRPLYGTMLAALNGRNDWMLAEGGAAVKLQADDGESHEGESVGAVGISGCFPATLDQEIADGLVEWLRTQL